MNVEVQNLKSVSDLEMIRLDKAMHRRKEETAKPKRYIMR
jgi:hypothetical protein